MKFEKFNSIKKKIRKYVKYDLFNHTRYRLTIFYSGLLILFLLLFMIIGYSIFYTMISSEQKQETTELTNQVLASNQIQAENLLLHGSTNEKIVITASNQEAYFCYVFDKNNKFVSGVDKMPILHSKILKKLKDWNIYPRAIKNLHTSYQENQNIYLQMARQSIFSKGKLIGYIYVGRDLTFYYNTLMRLLFILIGLALIFLVIASFIGYFMAKRAMIPIMEAYERQQIFVGDASHELRTPLSVLQSSLEVFEMDEAENISDFSYSVLLDMKDEVRSMKKLVEDLLALARFDSKNEGIREEEFDFYVVAKQILRTIKVLGEAKNIVIALEAQSPFIIRGDKAKLKQLLYILLDNAIKYSYEGGKIVVSLSNKLLQESSYFCIIVKDTGIGIAPELHDRIFDRFYREDKNRTRDTGGTGLGLAIARSIVDAHNGRIEVQSTPKMGSVFTVWIRNKIVVKNK